MHWVVLMTANLISLKGYDCLCYQIWQRGMGDRTFLGSYRVKITFDKRQSKKIELLVPLTWAKTANFGTAPWLDTTVLPWHPAGYPNHRRECNKGTKWKMSLDLRLFTTVLGKSTSAVRNTQTVAMCGTNYVVLHTPSHSLLTSPHSCV